MGLPKFVIQYSDSLNNFIYEPKEIYLRDIVSNLESAQEFYKAEIKIDDHYINLFHKDRDILQKMVRELYEYIKEVITIQSPPIILNNYKEFEASHNYTLQTYPVGSCVKVSWAEKP